MIATIPYIERKFSEFNQLMFGGKLPMLPVRLSRSKSFLGACVFKRRKTLWGKEQLYDFQLRISTAMDLPEEQLEDIIIHEMIHYYIGVNGLKDTSAHGQLFRQMMAAINERFGRHLSISHRLSQGQKAQMVDQKPHWHVVAVVSLRSGQVGLKVLPRVAPRIVTYYNQVSGSKEVASVKLFMTYDPYFNRFPNSTALRIHIVDEAELTQHLREAAPMHCDGQRVTRG